MQGSPARNKLKSRERFDLWPTVKMFPAVRSTVRLARTESQEASRKGPSKLAREDEPSVSLRDKLQISEGGHLGLREKLQRKDNLEPVLLRDVKFLKRKI